MGSANLALRFLLELAALTAVGYWGWNTSEGAMRWVVMLGAVLGVGAVWRLFVSPDPVIKLARPFRLAVEFAVWVGAGSALYATGQRSLAIAFVIVALGSGSLHYRWSVLP